MEYCPDHGEYEREITQAGNFSYTRPCPQCVKISREKLEAEKREEVDRERRQTVQALFRKSCIPKRFISCTINGYQAGEKKKQHILSLAKKYANDFETLRDKGTSLILCGKPGTGKTHIACAIGNALMQGLFSVRYTTVLKATLEIKSTYNKDSELREGDVLQSYVRVDLLILDEVGVQFGSNTENMLLYQIINGRYEEVKPTILISNYTEKELSEFIGERSIDRMREGGGAVAVFDWESYRKGGG